jgi:hypothetical protein
MRDGQANPDLTEDAFQGTLKPIREQLRTLSTMPSISQLAVLTRSLYIQVHEQSGLATPNFFSPTDPDDHGLQASSQSPLQRGGIALASCPVEVTKEEVHRRYALLKDLCIDFAKALKMKARKLTGLVYQERWFMIPIKAWRVSKCSIAEIKKSIEERISLLNAEHARGRRDLETAAFIEKAFLELDTPSKQNMFMAGELQKNYIPCRFIQGETYSIEEIPTPEERAKRLRQEIKDRKEYIDSLQKHIDYYDQVLQSIQQLHTNSQTFTKGWGLRSPYYYIREPDSQEGILETKRLIAKHAQEAYDMASQAASQEREEIAGTAAQSESSQKISFQILDLLRVKLRDAKDDLILQEQIGELASNGLSENDLLFGFRLPDPPSDLSQISLETRASDGISSVLNAQKEIEGTYIKILEKIKSILHVLAVLDTKSLQEIFSR